MLNETILNAPCAEFSRNSAEVYSNSMRSIQSNPLFHFFIILISQKNARTMFCKLNVNISLRLSVSYNYAKNLDLAMKFSNLSTSARLLTAEHFMHLLDKKNVLLS